MRERLIGALLLVIGAALGYWSVYQPLEAASRHDSKISLSMTGAILFPVLIVMGPLYLILGKRATDIFGSREKPTPVAWVAGIVLVAAGFGLYFVIRGALEAKGYQFNR